MSDAVKNIYMGVTTVAVLVCLSALMAYPFMLLWNVCLVPAIQGVQQVTWLQMWGISLLARFLFYTNMISSK